MGSIEEYIMTEVASRRLEGASAKALLHELERRTVAAPTKAKDIAIVGASCRLPGAPSLDAFWQLLQGETSAIGPFPAQRAADAGTHLPEGFAFGQAGYLDEIDKFDAAFFKISNREAELMDPHQRLFLETAWQAIEDAGQRPTALKGKKVGVFVGMETTYYSDYSKLVSGSDPLTLSGANVGIVASRIAYLLDLHGPAMVIDTACSSSLLALHKACQSIQLGESEAAIVGGLSLLFAPSAEKSLVDAEQSALLAFDKRASGTVWGEGAGALYLMPLDEAQKRRFPVYAVIKGGAVNSDGASNGITAPSADAQAELLREAWSSAGIDPATLSYIEAHGTGTKLGDPIEIKGITQAMAGYTQARQFLAIGSVKTVIGHLVGASGLAAVLKMILCFKHGKLTPTLGFREPNPIIPFAASPVYVQDQAGDWKRGASPRRCGVSSFGLSGTNCHLVLEEPPAAPAAYGHQPLSQLPFVLSAKTESALRRLLQSYAALAAQEDAELRLEDICGTAAASRDHYGHRLTAVVGSIDEWRSWVIAAANVPLADLPQHFPNVLYSTHRIVMKTANKAAGEMSEEEKLMLSRKAGEYARQQADSFRTAETQMRLCRLYAAGADLEWELLFPEGSYRRIHLPVYAFDRTRHWPEAPQAEQAEAAGQSRGAAGVISAIRGFGAAAPLTPLIDRQLAASMDRWIYETEFRPTRHWVLSDHRIAGEHVIPGTTYLNMAAEAGKLAFGQTVTELRNIQFYTPVIIKPDDSRIVHVIIDAVQGKNEVRVASLTGEVENPVWVVHMTGELSAAPISEPAAVDIERLKAEIGERVEPYTFSTQRDEMTFGYRWDLIRNLRFKQDHTGLLVELSQRPEFDHETKQFALHPALLDMATSPHMPDGLRLPFTYKSMKIYSPLPSHFYSYVVPATALDYSKEVLRFHIRLIDPAGRVLADIEEFVSKKVGDVQRTFVRKSEASAGALYETAWVARPLPEAVSAATAAATPGAVLLLLDERGLGRALAVELRAQGRDVIEAGLGNEFRQQDADRFTFPPDAAGFNSLLHALQTRSVSEIVHLASISPSAPLTVLGELADQQKRGIDSLFHLVKALAAQRYRQPLTLTLVGERAFAVTAPDAPTAPAAAALYGMGKSVGAEQANIRTRAIDIDADTTAGTLLAELASETAEYQVAYRAGQRYTPEFREVDADSAETEEVSIHGKGVYVITGGTGGLGLVMAGYLAGKGAANIALLSRSGFPERDRWEALTAEGADTKPAAQIEAIRAVERQGARVIPLAVPIASEAAVRQAMERLRAEFGRINGVIHAAGVAGDGFLFLKDEAVFHNVTQPKLEGTWLIDQATREDRPDFFVLFSSIASIIGGAGQSDYTAANSFLDAYPDYRRAAGGRTLTINWPSWRETGMAVDYGVNEDDLFKALGTAEALEGFDRVLRSGLERAVIGRLNEASPALRALAGASHLAVSASLLAKLQGGKSAAQPIAAKAATDAGGNGVTILKNGLAEDISAEERTIAQIWGQELGAPEVDVFDNFYELGGDSIVAIKIAGKIGERLELTVDSADIFEHLTVHQLAQHVLRGQGPRIETKAAATQTAAIAYEEDLHFLEDLAYAREAGKEAIDLLTTYAADFIDKYSLEGYQKLLKAANERAGA